MKWFVPIIFSALFFQYWTASAATGAEAVNSRNQTAIPLMTRLVKIFLGLEQELDQAARLGERGKIDRLLDADFELRSGSRPGAPIPGKDWLAEYAKNAAALPPFAIENMAARELGDLIAVSYKWPVQGKSDLFIVDLWRRDGESWRLTARYASRQYIEESSIPGAGEQPETSRKKSD